MPDVHPWDHRADGSSVSFEYLGRAMRWENLEGIDGAGVPDTPYPVVASVEAFIFAGVDIASYSDLVPTPVLYQESRLKMWEPIQDTYLNHFQLTILPISYSTPAFHEWGYPRPFKPGNHVSGGTMAPISALSGEPEVLSINGRYLRTVDGAVNTDGTYTFYVNRLPDLGGTTRRSLAITNTRTGQTNPPQNLPSGYDSMCTLPIGQPGVTCRDDAGVVLQAMHQGFILRDYDEFPVTFTAAFGTESATSTSHVVNALVMRYRVNRLVWSSTTGAFEFTANTDPLLGFSDGDTVAWVNP